MLPHRLDVGVTREDLAASAAAVAAAAAAASVAAGGGTGPLGTAEGTPLGGKHQCGLCGRYFTERNNLHRHMRIHTGFKPYRCPLCPYQSNRNGNLVRHMEFKHGRHH